MDNIFIIGNIEKIRKLEESNRSYKSMKRRKLDKSSKSRLVVERHKSSEKRKSRIRW